MTHILSQSIAAFWENDQLWGLTSRTLEAKNPRAAKVLSGFQTRELFHFLTPVFLGALLGFERSNAQVISLCLSSCEHVCMCCAGGVLGGGFWGSVWSEATPADFRIWNRIRHLPLFSWFCCALSSFFTFLLFSRDLQVSQFSWRTVLYLHLNRSQFHLVAK